MTVSERLAACVQQQRVMHGIVHKDHLLTSSKPDQPHDEFYCACHGCD